ALLAFLVASFLPIWDVWWLWGWQESGTFWHAASVVVLDNIPNSWKAQQFANALGGEFWQPPGKPLLVGVVQQLAGLHSHNLIALAVVLALGFGAGRIFFWWPWQRGGLPSPAEDTFRRS